MRAGGSERPTQLSPVVPKNKSINGIKSRPGILKNNSPANSELRHANTNQKVSKMHDNESVHTH